MTTSKPSKAAELADLRTRLEEAEQTLEAIRSGKVDALIVHGAEGERVFTLQGADHRYRRIVEGMTEGALVISPDGFILYANSCFALLVGVPLDQVLGSRLTRFVPETAVSTFERLTHAPQKGRAAVAETSLRTGDGEIVVVRISATADSELAEGAICLIVTDLTAMMRDVQSKLETERALARSEASERQFRELVENLPDLAWYARPDGYIEFFNRRWYEYTGTEPAQAEGWGWQSVHDPSLLPTMMGRWQESLATGIPFEMEYPLRRSDGVYRWFMTRVRALRDERGHIVRWFGTTTDVDDARRERQRAEALADALSQAVAARTNALQEAERVSRAKDEFLATMSHELRTPLNAMLGWATILMEDPVDHAKLARGLEIIERNARTQARLVSDLLDVSRIISGKLRLAVRRTNVAAIVNAAVDVVRQAAEAKEIRLEVDVAPGVGSLVADPDRLQQIVWNLVSNAVKFTPSRGSVVVTAECLASNIRLRVRDSGLGIPAEHLPFIFERLRQVDGTTTRYHGGLGLGLAIVRHLVEAHGGTVSAHSDGSGKGATFTVDLPIRAVHVREPEIEDGANRSATHTSSLHKGSLHGRRILIVEDDEDSLELLRFVLESAGASIAGTGRADQALEEARHGRFDIIISDIGMPGMDGYMFMRRLRTQLTATDVPAIALTAYARAEDAAIALSAGYQEHMTKPVDATALIVAVQKLVTKRNAGTRTSTTT